MISPDFPMLVQDQVSFKNTTGCMLLECIAMSVFSSNINLLNKFRTFVFCVWILPLQICNFIRVSQTQIRENIGNLNTVESYILTDNHHGAEISVIWLVERSAIKLLILIGY